MASIVPIVLALAAQMPSVEGGDAVILETLVTSPSVAEEDAVDVETFLAERISDAWGVPVSRTPPIEDGGRHFYVTLDWKAPTAVGIRVAERDVVHVDRAVQIADPDSGRAILWLSIRSSIERALAAMPEAPAVSELLEQYVAEAETATAAEVETEEPPLTTDVAGPAPTVVEHVPDRDPIDPRLYASFDTLWLRKRPPSEGSITTSVLMKAGIEGGLATGPAAQVHYVLGRWLTVGGELGYYNVGFTNDVEVDHIPITAMASLQPDLSVPLELGARATLDIQAVTEPNNTMFGVRFLTGPYARSALPFYVGDGDQASFVAELRLDFALVRGRYALDGGRSFVDPLVGLSGAVGVEYRWR